MSAFILKAVTCYRQHIKRVIKYTLKLLADYFETSIDYLVGHTDIRHKVEAVQPFDLNADEAILIEKYRQLGINARNSVINVMDTFLEQGK